MENWPINFHPDAIAEAQAAYSWYHERSPKAAEAFMRELDLAIERISLSPHTWPSYVGETRRYLFKRFPFSVAYAIEDNSTLVLAVAHARRKPGYWKIRLPNQ